MNTQEQLIEAVHAGKRVINNDSDPLVFIEGNLVATDKNGVSYPVVWVNPKEWHLSPEIKNWDDAGTAIEKYKISLDPVYGIGDSHNWMASLAPIIDDAFPWAEAKTPFEAIEKLILVLENEKS